MTLTFIIVFALTALLLALALVYSNWPNWLKGLLALGVSGFYFFGFGAVHSLLGIPSTDALPERFVMLAALIDEPRPKFPGALYVWVTPIEEGKSFLQPRAYKLPYTRSLHEQISDGMRKGREGIPQMGTAEIKQQGSGKGASWLNPGSDEQEVKILDLPTPQVPEK
jgi:hypothetical protein